MASPSPSSPSSPPSTQARKNSVSIHARYTITKTIGNDTNVSVTEHSFDGSNCEEARIGVPVGVTPSKPKPGDYTYSGMHDFGTLSCPKEGGDTALLIGLVAQAKKKSDEFLTQIIEQEKKEKRSNQPSLPMNKKLKKQK